MNYMMSKWLAFLVRTFPGIKRNLINFGSIKNAKATIFDGIVFPFDLQLMDKKRFIAIAAGAIEMEEIAAAKKYITNTDIVVELGAGIGISASRINKVIKPKKHICFEANPKLIPYLRNLFKINKLNIDIVNLALGNNENTKFYACDDYILSSFLKPKYRSDYIQFEVGTISCQKIIDIYSPTVLFCDIEGAELKYLNALNFKTVKTIIIELHPKMYGIDGLKKIHQRLKVHGFFESLRIGDTYCFTRTNI